MKVLRNANHRRMPWKNGGGETVEIAVFPPEASVDTFGWRVSMAVVATDGPFSVFPGVDRTLSILDGRGMMLDVAGLEPVALTTDTAPYAFPADAPTRARLVDGAIADLNVMTRRGAFGHTVERRVIDGVTEVKSLGQTLLMVPLGDIEVGKVPLGHLDAMLTDADVTIGTDEPVTVYLIRIDPV